MCSRYTYTKDEAKLRLRDKILVFGAVPRANIRPTDLGPVIVPEEDGFACREMRWGWSVPWDKGPFINAKSETLTTLNLYDAQPSSLLKERIGVGRLFDLLLTKQYSFLEFKVWF